MKENLRANDREQYLKRKLQETNELNAKESMLCKSLRGIFFIGEVCVPELREPSQQLYLQRCQPLVAPYLPGPLPLLVWYLGPWPSAGIFSFLVDLIGRLRLPHYSVARRLPHYRLVSLLFGVTSLVSICLFASESRSLVSISTSGSWIMRLNSTQWVRIHNNSAEVTQASRVPTTLVSLSCNSCSVVGVSRTHLWVFSAANFSQNLCCLSACDLLDVEPKKHQISQELRLD